VDQAILVIYRLGDGQKLIEQLVRDGLEIMAAFWLYTNDNERWTLNLICKAVDKEGPRNSYGAIVRAFEELPDLQLDSVFDVTLLGPSQPLARGVLTHLKRHPYKYTRRVEQTLLGDVYVESAYIYPPELLRPAEAVTKDA
jgi:hypothetical protein